MPVNVDFRPLQYKSYLTPPLIHANERTKKKTERSDRLYLPLHPAGPSIAGTSCFSVVVVSEAILLLSSVGHCPSSEAVSDF